MALLSRGEQGRCTLAVADRDRDDLPPERYSDCGCRWSGGIENPAPAISPCYPDKDAGRSITERQCSAVEKRFRERIRRARLRPSQTLPSRIQTPISTVLELGRASLAQMG